MPRNLFHDDDNDLVITRLTHRRHEHPSDLAVDSEPDRPPEGERWSSWDGATHGPQPRPHWVITDLGAVEADLGVLKTGKEADVHLVHRWVPGDPARDVVMAGKRYRSSKHRMFHRDAGYLEGRRVRKSRETRAMRTRTSFGKELISGLWAFAEFETLVRLWYEGLPVPYPVQMAEDEMLMEFIAAPGGGAAPRLAQTRPGARGALFMYSCLPVSEFGEAWPEEVPVQIHGKEGDEFFDEDLPAARQLAGSTAAAELFLYPGDQHYFADSSLPSYDAEATALLLERVRRFLAALA